MVDVANLNVNIGSNAKKAITDLDSLVKVAGRLGASMIRAEQESSRSIMRLVNSTTGVDRSFKSAQASANVFNQELQKESAALQRLQAQLDPVIAAKQRLETQTEQITNALRIGAITQEEFNRTLVAAKVQYDANVVSATRLSGALRQSATPMNRYAMAATQAGFQVQDFSVQVAAGTNAMLALNQQLPQLLGAFGSFGKIALIGSILGTIAAVAGAVVPKLIAMADETKQLENNVKSLGEAARDFRASVNDAIEPIDKMIEKYGILANEARKAFEVIAKGERRSAESLAASTIESVAKPIRRLADLTAEELAQAFSADLPKLTKEYQKFFSVISTEADSVDLTFGDIRSQEQQIQLALRFQQVVGDINDELGVGTDVAEQLVLKFRELEDAENLAQRVRILDDVLLLMERAADSQGELTTEGQSFLQALADMIPSLALIVQQTEIAAGNVLEMDEGAKNHVQTLLEAIDKQEQFTQEVIEAFRAGKDLSELNLADGITPAVTAAEILADQLRISLGLARQIVAISAMSAEQQRISTKVRAGLVPPEALADVGLNPDLSQSERSPDDSGNRAAVDIFSSQVDDRIRAREAAEKAARKSGGGGRAKKEEDPFADLIKRRDEIIQNAKSNQELYNEAVSELDLIQAELGLTTQQYNNELDLLSQKYLDAGGAAEFFAEQQRILQDGFLDLIVKGESFADVLVTVAENIAKAALQAALFGTGPMAGLFGGSAGGGILGLLGFATGTNNAPGGPAIVGERGPEIVNLPKGSQVIPSEQTSMKLDRMSAPAPELNNNFRFVNVLDPNLVGDYLATPQGEQLVVNIVSRNQQAS